MTAKDLQHILKILTRVKPQDGHVLQAIASVEKKLAEYDARRGQLADQYEYDNRLDW